MVGRREDDRARDQIFGRRSGKFFLCWRTFRDRDVTGRFNEFLELLVCNRRCIHPESIYANAMNGAGVIRGHWHFMAPLPVHGGAHRKFATRNPDHSFRRGAPGLRIIYSSWSKPRSCVVLGKAN